MAVAWSRNVAFGWTCSTICARYRAASNWRTASSNGASVFSIVRGPFTPTIWSTDFCAASRRASSIFSHAATLGFEAQTVGWLYGTCCARAANGTKKAHRHRLRIASIFVFGMRSLSGGVARNGRLDVHNVRTLVIGAGMLILLLLFISSHCLVHQQGLRDASSSRLP